MQVFQKASLFLNGEKPTKEMLLSCENDFKICADGAYNYLHEYGIKPNVVIGDMDSLLFDIPSSVEVVKYEVKKNMTDGEIALDYLVSMNYNKIDIYGCSGKRDDHYIANFGLLYRAYKKGVSCKMITPACDIYLCDSLFKMNLPIGTTLSIVPFFEKTHIINTKGLEYAVENKEFTFDSSLGISNVVCESNVEVAFKNGTALVFVVKNNF